MSDVHCWSKIGRYFQLNPSSFIMKRLIVVRTQISQMNVPNNDKSARGGVILGID